MHTIWGRLENVEELSAPSPHVQVRTSLPGGIVIRVRASIGAHTLIARGINAVDVSGLREGEFVEVAYQQSKEGKLNALRIYVRPEQTAVG